MSNRNIRKSIAPNAKHFVNIGLRKILASSSFAISDTLKGMVERLKAKQEVNEEDKLIDDISEKLKLISNVEHLFSARWTLSP